MAHVDDIRKNVAESTIHNPHKQKAVNRYTLRKRKSKEVIGQYPLHKRIAFVLEGVNRRAWYALFRFIFYTRPVESKIPIGELRSLLIIPIGDAVGDMVVTLPLIDAIKRRNPNVKVGVIKSARNESLLRCEDQIDELYTFVNRKDWKHFGELLRARRENYQIVLNLHFPQMTEYGIVANIAGPKAIKVSVTHSGRKNIYLTLFDHLSKAKRFRVHLTQLSLKLLDDVIEFDPPIAAWESGLRLTLSEDTLAQMQQRVQSILHEHHAKWYIYYNPEARNPFREFGLDNFFQFAQRFTEKYSDAAIVLTSSPVRQSTVKKAISDSGLKRVAFIDTSFDLLELGALCRFAKLVITPDTSVIHFAAAERTPTLILWADPSNLPVEWLPLHTPCIHLCPPAVGAPVSQISVDDVLAAASELVDGTMTESLTSYSRAGLPVDAFQITTRDSELMPLIAPHIRLDD